MKDCPRCSKRLPCGDKICPFREYLKEQAKLIDDQQQQEMQAQAPPAQQQAMPQQGQGQGGIEQTPMGRKGMKIIKANKHKNTWNSK